MGAQQAKQSGRWLEGVDAGTPPAEVALAALDSRLRTVIRRLDAVGGIGDGDPDRLRKLRVSIRRASVAMQAFDARLSRKRARRARRRLNRIRRAAGRVRDAHEHRARLDSWTVHDEDEAAAIAHLREAVGRLIIKRQRRLRELIARHGERLGRDVHRLLASLHDPRPTRSGGSAAATFGDLAGGALAGILRDLGAATSADLSNPEHLHALRIACRRLRYAIELFAGALPGAARAEVYPALVSIQDQLGEVGDAFTFLERMERLSRRERRRCPDSHVAGQLEAIATRSRADYEACVRRALAFLRAQGLQDLRQIQQALAEWTATHPTC